MTRAPCTTSATTAAELPSGTSVRRAQGAAATGGEDPSTATQAVRTRGTDPVGEGGARRRAAALLSSASARRRA